MDPRERMVQSAVLLLAEHGYQGTSFSSVLAHSGAPRGSVYHHFPGGKDELIAAALERTVDVARASLEPLHGLPLADVLREVAGWWRRILTDGGFRRGCPLVAVSGGTGAAHPLTAVVKQSFLDWEDALAGVLGSAPDVRADPQTLREAAALLLASCEGALAYGRATQSIERFDQVVEAVHDDVTRMLTPAQVVVDGARGRRHDRPVPEPGPAGR